MIPYGRQNISEDDISAVVEVLRSDYLTQGPVTPRFEAAVASYTGARHAVAVNSATSALHIACLALGLKPGDVAWTVPNTFVASANCALYCGADVDFVDIDPVSWNMSVSGLEDKLEATRRSGGRMPKVVIPVHFSGEPCDMARIGALADAYGFKVIEDASHAIGARFGDQPVGRCTHSAITVFSFHPVKIVTSGEGGMATTNDPDLAQRMALLRSHGVTRDQSLMTRETDGPWYYQQIGLGFNYRMTEIGSALGLSQMDRIEDFISRRHAIARRYDSQLAGLPLTRPVRVPHNRSGLHLYVIRVHARGDGARHRRVFEALRAADIGVNLHYIPVHLQPYYADLGFKAGQYPEAESYYREAISLPMFPDLSEADQDYVVTCLSKALA